ncbi:MAG: DUF1631 domain-containing protein [Gammaproteobacteria bacterium]
MNDTIQDKIIRMPIPPHHQRRGEGPSQMLRILSECKQQSITYLQSSIARMMDKTDDALFERAEKALNNQKQTLYFDAMREIRLIRKDVESCFLQRITDQFSKLTEESPEISPSHHKIQATGSNISLVDTDMLEQQLAITTMISKTRQQCAQPLYTLEKRLGFLISKQELQYRQNPLGPENLCHAFGKAIEKMSEEIEIRLLILKLFDQNIVSHLDSFYDYCNQILSSKGILPDIKQELSHHIRQSMPPRYQPQMQPDSSQTKQRNSVLSVEEKDVLNQLTQLQQINQTGKQGNIPAGSPSHTENILYSVKQSDLGGILGQNGEMVIDVVAMLFDYILDDTNTPTSMRAVIGRLQIPMLKVALMDNSFFSRKSHPARQLLNMLSSAAIHLDEKNIDTDPLARMVTSIIQTILDQFDDEISIFSELLEDFKSFIDSEHNVAEKYAEKTIQLAAGQEKLAIARQTAESEIQQRPIIAIPAADSVRSFINTHWKNLLLLICAKDGKDSHAWSQAIETMDNLIWSIKPKKDQGAREQLMNIQKSLLVNLQNGMQRLSVPAYERDAFLAELMKIQGMTLLTGDVENNDMINTPVENKCEDKSKPEADILDDKYHQLATSIQIGTWVQFRESADDISRAKCSWISPLTDSILFTDRLGRKVCSLSTAEFADKLRQLRARILDDQSAIDRILEKGMQACGDSERQPGEQP